RLLARRGVARERRDEGGKLGNAVPVRRQSKQVYGSMSLEREFHPKPSSRFVQLAWALRTLPLRQRFKAWGGRDSSRRFDGSPPAL
ncbi:MAG: hypothetical protein AAF546_13765, partial [Verrucomicrobiota bacterium]